MPDISAMAVCMLLLEIAGIVIAESQMGHFASAGMAP
ncbi:hypothetical protein GGD50_000160 [Rhizobium paranaense]|uniref:Uncharacterized protein n=1 Tax=Rhizobium paranaense TaxID=1650438 RepID=A0A7W8XLT9_9HYPH|nr:hypothetical protein [Rhizobium paranaense]